MVLLLHSFIFLQNSLFIYAGLTGQDTVGLMVEALGVYVYAASLVLTDGTKEVKKGSFNLLR